MGDAYELMADRDGSAEPPSLMNLAALLVNCRDRQYRMYGCHPETMPAAQRAAYLRDMVLALHSEADECLRTMFWKPWAGKQMGEYAVSVEDRAAEIVDVLLFTMNVALALGVGPDTLATALALKTGAIDAPGSRWKPAQDVTGASAP